MRSWFLFWILMFPIFSPEPSPSPPPKKPSCAFLISAKLKHQIEMLKLKAWLQSQGKKHD